MVLDIKITGSGNKYEIAAALKQIALDIENDIHVAAIEEKGISEWEDSSLFTTIQEEIG